MCIYNIHAHAMQHMHARTDTCMHAYMCSNTHVHAIAYVIYVHARTDACICTHARTCMHTHARTEYLCRMGAGASCLPGCRKSGCTRHHIHVYIRVYARMHARTHACTHARTDACKHAYNIHAHANTCVHIDALASERESSSEACCSLASCCSLSAAERCRAEDIPIESRGVFFYHA